MMSAIVLSLERCMVRLKSILKEQITSDSLEHRFLRKTRVRMVVPQLIFSMQEISWIHACINT